MLHHLYSSNYFIFCSQVTSKLTYLSSCWKDEEEEKYISFSQKNVQVPFWHSSGLARIPSWTCTGSSELFSCQHRGDSLILWLFCHPGESDLGFPTVESRKAKQVCFQGPWKTSPCHGKSKYIFSPPPPLPPFLKSICSLQQNWN